MKFTNVISILLVLASRKNARSAFITSYLPFTTGRESTKLDVSSTSRYSRRRGKRLHVNDEWYLVAIAARDCARSPDSSIEEAEEYLQKMLGMEAGCLTGSISSNSDVCADPLWFAEIVDDLRNKLGYDGPTEYSPSKSHETEGHVQPNLDEDLHP